MLVLHIVQIHMEAYFHGSPFPPQKKKINKVIVTFYHAILSLNQITN